MPLVGNRLLHEAFSERVENWRFVPSGTRPCITRYKRTKSSQCRDRPASRQGRDTKRVNPPKECVVAPRPFFGLSAKSAYPAVRIMSDMTPVDMQKKGSATSGFQRIAEVALQDLAVFSLVRVPCDKTIIKACSTLQFSLYCCGTCDGTGTRYRSEVVAHLVFPSVSLPT